MSLNITKKLPALLSSVEKPGRYVGGEVNCVIKPAGDVTATMLLAFPDIYDIGMSYHGFKILYELINAAPHFAAERTFAPWPDMEQRMRDAAIPLYALESKRPAIEFDLIGFTLQHEVNYTNVLNMIDLAGLPVESSKRSSAFPLIIAGGEGALAPEPLAPFIDLFVLGDGEQVAMDLMSAVEEFKNSGSDDKAELLRVLSQIPGTYVPSLYTADYAADGTLAAFYRIGDERKSPVAFERQLFDLASTPGPLKPVIPSLRVIHDRLAIEIKRGCARGCRFCAAGMINRPVRERTPDQILDIARNGLANTGFDEISLLSLSSADYTCILPTVRMLQREFDAERVSISLPSLRINSFDVSLAEEIAQVRKSGFTFAPEAGTERLRAVINKPLDEQAFLKIIDLVCSRGWKTLKFYFMLGLPTETDEDLDGIISLVKRAEDIGRRRWNNNLQINVGLSPFVPKPHTPFQWAAQVPAEELDRRHRYVAGRLRNKRISIKGQNRELSFIEAVLARGDRRLSAAIKRAWELGAKFDGWDEHFRFDVWQQAFAEANLDPAFYANRERTLDEILPWDHIDTGPGKPFLQREWHLAMGEKTVPDCSAIACVGCDACNDHIDHFLANEHWQSPEELLLTVGRYEDIVAGETGAPRLRRSKDGATHEKLTPPLIVRPQEETTRKNTPRKTTMQEMEIQQRLRFRFSRTGDLRYLSHLDVMKVLQLACVRAGVKPAYTDGFNPRPKMSFMPPLALGCETLDDYFDLVLIESMAPLEALKRLNAQMPHGPNQEGMFIHGVAEVALHATGPEAALSSADYQVVLSRNSIDEKALGEQRVLLSISTFRAASSIPFSRPATQKRGEKNLDLKTTLLDVKELEFSPDGLRLLLSISHKPGEYADPLCCINALLSLAFVEEDAEIVRVESHLDQD